MKNHRNVDIAESIKLEEKFDELNYDWDKAKEAFQKFKIERESNSQSSVHEINYVDRRSRSAERRTFYRRKSGSRSRERRSSTPKFNQRYSSNPDIMTEME